MSEAKVPKFAYTNESRLLVQVLRHNLSQFESCDARGFVPVEDAIREISKSKKCKKGITADIVATIVEQERLHGKERLQLKQNDQKQWLISATQGHSSGRTEYDAVLEPCEFLLHGTEARFKESIEQKGLLKMHRTHIHCISCDPAKLDSTKIKSGFKNTSDMLVVIDMQATMEAGLKWFKADNGVFLSEGPILPCFLTFLPLNKKQ
jgi:2'-phosphotransferase